MLLNERVEKLKLLSEGIVDLASALRHCRARSK